MRCGPASTGRLVDAPDRLRVAAAIGVSGDVEGRAKALLAADVDVLVIDTAHGHQDKMIYAVGTVRALDPPVPVVAGNVVTPDGVRDLVAPGPTSSRSASGRAPCAPPG